jgi:hypothetical protein
MTVQAVHPAAPRCRPDPGVTIYRDRTIERSQQTAPVAPCVIVCAREVEQRRISEGRYLFYDPFSAANDNAIAGREGHACVMAMVIPWKIYPQRLAF